MVIREGVHNALIHSSPTYVRISVAYSEDLLTVTTEDDGVGFDAAAKLPPSPGHFGLQGMYERSKRIGAQLQIDSSVGKGTVLEITATASSCRDNRMLERV
jgi:signal transduction histidine kinase